MNHVDEVVDLTAGMQFLTAASTITFPHWNFTRYPDLAMKPSEHDENLGIVLDVEGAGNQNLLGSPVSESIQVWEDRMNEVFGP